MEKKEFLRKEIVKQYGNIMQCQKGKNSFIIVNKTVVLVLQCCVNKTASWEEATWIQQIFLTDFWHFIEFISIIDERLDDRKKFFCGTAVMSECILLRRYPNHPENFEFSQLKFIQHTVRVVRFIHHLTSSRICCLFCCV